MGWEYDDDAAKIHDGDHGDLSQTWWWRRWWECDDDDRMIITMRWCGPGMTTTNLAQLQTKHARKMLPLDMVYLSECPGSHSCWPGFAHGKSVPLLYMVIHGWPRLVHSTSCKALPRAPKLPPTSLAKTGLQRTHCSTGRRQKRNSWHKTTTTPFAVSYLILYHLWQVDYARRRELPPRGR